MIEDIIRSGVEQFTDELEQNSADYKRAVNELDEIEDINDSENELPSANRNKSDENRTKESSIYTNHSGGAIGSDGNNSQVDNNILSEEELKEAQEIKKHCKGE